MTNQEIIQALKSNEKPFGLMGKELQEKAQGIGLDHFEIWRSSEYDKAKWGNPANKYFDYMYTYRLRPDFQEEPERIELEIAKSTDGELMVYEEGHGGRYYTVAPALFPKEGYGFIGFRYNLPAPNEIRPEPVMYINKFGSVCRAWIEGCKVVKPIAAVYQKEAQCS
jgi:hypothetical protein